MPDRDELYEVEQFPTVPLFHPMMQAEFERALRQKLFPVSDAPLPFVTNKKTGLLVLFKASNPPFIMRSTLEVTVLAFTVLLNVVAPLIVFDPSDNKTLAFVPASGNV